jgi:serine/threonine-protein kinase
MEGFAGAMNQTTLPVPGALLAGKYRVERLLGRGGMGAVFAAQHEVLGRRVAIKLLLTDTAQSEEGLQRFLNEARAAARLDSEHITRLMDFGTLENGLPFMVLEFLAGQDLGQVLAGRGPLPVAEVVDYMLQACEALAQAHAAGIIHRDLKPSNLFLAQRGDGSLRIKVLDFGISKINNPAAVTPKSLTSTRALLGTPYYMSPEQLARPKEVDARADVWQLGANIFELLVGSPPFMQESLGELLYAIMNQPVPSIREKRPDVPPELELTVFRCMERDMSRRFANVGELAQAIAPFGSGAHAPLVARVAHTLQASGLPFGFTPGPNSGGPALGVTPGLAPSARSGPLQTSNAWGHASSAPLPPPRSKTLFLVAGILGGLTVLGAVAVVLGMRTQIHRATFSISQPSAVANTQAEPPSAAATPSNVPAVEPSTVTTLAPLVAVNPSTPPAAPVASSPPSVPVAAAPAAAPAATPAATPDAGARPPKWNPPVRPHPPAPPVAPRPAAPPTPTDSLPDNSRQ